MEKSPILTIAIPTYNRNEKLLNSIRVLIPQLNSKVNLLILDNCSTIPVFDAVNEFSSSNVKVVRNKYNIGMAANIIRCFEYCETDWMWLLGDDDTPTCSAVQSILSDIQNNSDCCFLNYKSHMCSSRKYDYYTVGQEELIDKLDSFGNLLFISTGVYNLVELSGDLRLSYQLSYSIAPHLIYLLSGIGTKKKSAFLAKEIQNFKLWETTEEESWSWLSLSLCIPVLYEVPLLVSSKVKRKFANHILTHVKSPKEVYSIIEQPKYLSMNLSQKRFYLRQIYFRSLLFSSYSNNLFNYFFSDVKLLIKHTFSRKKSGQISVLVDDRI